MIIIAVDDEAEKRMPETTDFIKALRSGNHQERSNLPIYDDSSPLFWHQMFPDTIVGYENLNITVLFWNPSMHASVYISYTNKLEDSACDDMVACMKSAVPSNTRVHFCQVTYGDCSANNDVRVELIESRIMNEVAEKQAELTKLDSIGTKMNAYSLGDCSFEFRRWKMCDLQFTMEYHQRLENTAMWMIDGKCSINSVREL